MDVRDHLSDAGQVVLALCSSLALPEETAAGATEPFKLSEWNQLERQIQKSAFKEPSALRGHAADKLAKELTLGAETAERIVRLLDRSGRLALELETLFSRGMWALTRVDEAYPARLRENLKHQAPSVLFGAGDLRLLQPAGIAVIGSRNIDDAGAAFAREVGHKAAAAKMSVISGGARGTDRIAMDGALAADGSAIGIMADSLETTIRKSDVRQFLLDDRLVLLTPYAPTAGFSVGAAMGRNKIIYGLAAFAVVVSSDFQTGGTWAGAVEALKAGWCLVFAREGEAVPIGNRELLKLGAAPLTQKELENIDNVAEWMRQHATTKSEEPGLFDSPGARPQK